MKNSAHWHLLWCLTEVIDQVVLNAKVLNAVQENCNMMVAVTREIGQSVR